MEEERIQKFKDLILNEHYCEDCNELCAIGEAFPLEFVTKYIIKLEKENQSYRDYLGEPPCYDNASYIPKSKVKEKIEELDKKILEYEAYRETGKETDEEYYDFIANSARKKVLQELMGEK